MNESLTTIKGILSHGTIAYHPIFAKAFNSVPIGVYLSQGYFWQENAKFRSKDTHKEIEGETFFCKTASDWTDETGLSLEQQMGVRKKLRTCGIITEKKMGVPAKLWINIHLESLVLVINEYLKTGNTAFVDNRTKPGFKAKASVGKIPKQGLVKNGTIIVESDKESSESKKESIAGAKPRQGSNKKSDGVIHGMLQAFETEHKRHFLDGVGEWQGFTWQKKEFGALESIRKEIEKRYREKTSENATPDQVLSWWRMFLDKAVQDQFTRDKLFTPTKLWGNFQIIVQKIHENANGKKPNNDNEKRIDAVRRIIAA